MSRFFTLCAAILMLALVAAVPAVTEAPEAPTQVEQEQAVQVEPAQLDLVLAEEPLMTPVEQPEGPDLAGLEQPKRVNKFRLCEEEEEAQCPPGCNCVFYRNAVHCRC